MPSGAVNITPERSVESAVTALKLNVVKIPLPAGTAPPVSEIPRTIEGPVDTVNPAASAAPPDAPSNVRPLTSNWKPATSLPKSYKISKLPEASNAPSDKLARHDEPSPSHTPQSSTTAVEPHVSSHPDGAASPQPHPKSSAEPLHSPAQSTAAEPLQSPAQSATASP